MDKSAEQPVKPKARSRLRGFVTGLVLVGIIYFSLSTLLAYQLHQRVFHNVKLQYGRVIFGYDGPGWIPESVREVYPIFNRIHEIELLVRDLPPGMYSDLGQLTSLEKLRLQGAKGDDAAIRHLCNLPNLSALDISGSQITDTGLEQLKTLRKLGQLRLLGTSVSDQGLDRLNEMHSLEFVDLRQTQTTEGGRNALRLSLPKCQVVPDP